MRELGGFASRGSWVRVPSAPLHKSWSEDLRVNEDVRVQEDAVAAHWFDLLDVVEAELIGQSDDLIKRGTPRTARPFTKCKDVRRTQATV